MKGKEKRIEVYGISPQPLKGSFYVMVPSGMYCNDGLRKVEAGALIRLKEGWKGEDYRLVDKVAVRTDTEVFDFFFRSVFRGWNVTREEIWERWDAMMLMAGKGRKVVSRKEVWILELILNVEF